MKVPVALQVDQFSASFTTKQQVTPIYLRLLVSSFTAARLKLRQLTLAYVCALCLLFLLFLLTCALLLFSRIIQALPFSYSFPITLWLHFLGRIICIQT